MKKARDFFMSCVLNAVIVILFSQCSTGFGYAKSSEIRVVSLAPSLTEIVFELGAGAELVGNTSDCNYPLSALQVKKVGSFAHPNLEKILALSPDLILATEGNDPRVLAQLARTGKKVLYSAASSIGQVGVEFLKIGRSLGKSAEAEKWVSAFSKQLLGASLVKKRASKKVALVLLELDPVMAVGPRTWLGSVFETAGFVNEVKAEGASYPLLEKESLLKMKPDWVFFEKRFSEKTVRSKLELDSKVKTFAMDSDVFLRPGPRISIALNQLIALQMSLVP
jgi:iron complex transport system substrate-binding protein